MKTLYIILSFLAGVAVTIVFEQVRQESFYGSIRKDNERYLAEKQEYRTENTRLKSELENCKLNYKSVADSYFDSEEEYDIK